MAKTGGKGKRGARKAVKGKRTTGAKKRATRPARRMVAKRPAAKRAAKSAARPATPSVNPLRALAQRIIDVTINNDDNATLALYSDNIESIERGAPPMTGIDAIKQKFHMWRQMTSSAVFTPRLICVDGNTIIIEWEGTVTLAPSGKVVRLEEVAVHEIENGKIKRERFYYDPSILQP